MFVIWKLDKTKKEPLYQQLLRQIISSIQQGELTPGQRLPAERKLAETLNVNRSTVVHTFEELTSLGWVERRQGSGTHVTQGQWGNRQPAIYQWRTLFSRPLLKEDPYVTQLKEQKENPNSLDLYTGDLSNDLIPDFKFPAMTWEQMMQEEKLNTSTGYIPLKEQIFQHFFQDISQKGQDLLITAGSTQGISFLIQALLSPGDVIATEDPSFLFSLPLFAAQGVSLKGIKQDQKGINCQALEELIQKNKIKLLYLNPNHQNPTGVTMTLKRRKEVIQICQKYHLPIIEDDVFRELSFETLTPSLKSLAPDQVIYLGSLSKIFSSSIKIGWLFAPQPLIKSLANAKRSIENQTDLLPQLLATAALSQHNYKKQQLRLSQQLQNRRQNFLNILQSFQDDWKFSPIDGGLYYWVTWRQKNLTRNDWQLFLKERLLVAPSFLFSNETSSMRINYTHLNEDNGKIFKQKLSSITRNLQKNK
ncbi:GntR family transcriptional regulator [Alicyclobacillus contaminans]|uniref:GntR family transcriptional regulator n=1 Tax=Tetragenococcus osmophilus TaxID=526944 RepID=A0AA38CW08_9ENTE|nr:PLP-dependent aminotransferase family protein [Tetragenococcus osmophilus]GMA53572.1 GntR family transcriptional regulator [Alicyclobacillus contaminans]GMA72488.1 GntR family transcriptional regulator [Tetragenococcus osmophilus]